MEDKLKPCPIPNCRGKADVYNGGNSIWCELVYRYFIWISCYGSGPEFEARIIWLDTGKWPKWYKPSADIPHHEITGTVFTDFEKELWHDFFENNK